MAIEQNRVEALARWMYVTFANGSALVAWSDVAPDHRKLWMSRASMAAEVLYPELASDPPTGWVAPWEATDAMAASIWGCPRDEAQRAWAAMRDAHLKEQGHA